MSAVSPELEEVPRPGRKILWRGLAAFAFVMVMTAAAVGKIGLLQLDTVLDDFRAAGGKNAIDLPEVTPSEAGKPQTIMLLGTDGRLGDDKAAGQRSDTIILAHLDAKKPAITLMSIPRDLKVTLPGSGVTDKINSAFARGGTRLTLKTVKALLSRPGEPFKINHVVQVNFSGFRRMVDYLQCTFVDVDRHYFNDIGGPGGYATIDIDAGYQKICGEDALAYVRYRHTDNDLIRGARQQDFLRQMLRGRSVRKKLSFDKRSVLAKIAGKYTRTDRSLLQKGTLLSLLKLGLGVADKPVQQVTFGAGKIQDEGDYLVASDSAIEETLEQFLNPKTVTEETEKKAPKTSSSKSSKKSSKSKKKSSSSSVPSGLVDIGTSGENYAIAVNRRLRFPFYFPKLGAAGSTYANDAERVYRIPANHRYYQAYRLVLSMGGSALPKYYGVQGMTWRPNDPKAGPPILDGPHDTLVRDGRKLNVYYDGKKVRLVSWQTKKAVYWVSNTLTRDISYSRMVAIARSLKRLGT